MKVNLTRGRDSEIEYTRVTNKVEYRDGKYIVKPSNNLIQDTWAYEIEYWDRRIEILFAIIIVENIISQVNAGIFVYYGKKVHIMGVIKYMKNGYSVQTA